MRVSFWINAFIPGTVPNYTQVIEMGEHAGKSAIPLPGAARLANWFKKEGSGFLTDQRGFDAAPGASTRMRSIAEIEIKGETATLISAKHETSGTYEVDISDGSQLGFADANLKKCRFGSLIPTSRARTGQTVKVLGFNAPEWEKLQAPAWDITVSGAGSDPLVFGSADIDYTGTFTIALDPTDQQKVTVSFNGKIDAFPAFEAYARVNCRTQTLFQSPPPPGNTVMNLLGWANRTTHGSATFYTGKTLAM